MADLPITFSGPMVRAILREIEKPGAGKTQTRRVLKPQPRHGAEVFCDGGGYWYAYTKTGPGSDCVEVDAVEPRYAVGDRLYVREHWWTEARWDSVAPRDLPETAPIYPQTEPEPGCAGRFRQAMHMPKWASRITLIVTDVRVERLQDCSEADALAEGIDRIHFPERGDWGWPQRAHAKLWDDINGPGAWAANPWVAAYTFRPVLGNIDQLAEAA